MEAIEAVVSSLNEMETLLRQIREDIQRTQRIEDRHVTSLEELSCSAGEVVVGVREVKERGGR